MSTQSPKLSPQTLTLLRHDLRTPLNHISGYCEILLEDAEADGDTAATKDLREIRSISAELTGLVQSMVAPRRQGITVEDIDGLRGQLAPLANDIIRIARGLMPKLQEEGREDLVRVGQAAIALLSVPLRSEGAGSIPAGANTPSVASSGPAGSGRLLVVDDLDENRAMLRRQLERQGYQVDEAADGLEALRLMAASKFDLVLLDVLMPGMDGIQVLERMKSDEALRSTPVLMLSATDEIQSVVRCMESGAEDYLLKPFEPVLLRARIHSVLERVRPKPQ